MSTQEATAVPQPAFVRMQSCRSHLLALIPLLWNPSLLPLLLPGLLLLPHSQNNHRQHYQPALSH
jgi:hypothetical protein